MHDERHLSLIDVDRHRLVRAAARLLGPGEAEDAVQDAYVRALEAVAPELNVAQAWLLTVVRNLAIDRLRRRGWMQQWLSEVEAQTAVRTAPPAAPSAEADAGLAEEAERALRLLASRMSPADGAAVLLHQVFDYSHAEIAQASGKTETACRQQVRRMLLRLRGAGQTRDAGPRDEFTADDDSAFQRYVQCLRSREPQALFALLRQPPAQAALVATATAGALSAAPPRTGSSLVLVGGQLGLVLTLDGMCLCVLPLGVRSEVDQPLALSPP